VVGLGVPATIHDARIDRGVEIAPNDSMELLIDGPGFLLAHAPSAVNDWTDKDEVAKIYYAEATALVQSLLPSAELAQLRSHTFRNEDIKDHHWIDGIQYGPCAEFVHNDYADFMTPDRQGVTKSFAEVMGMPTDKRVIGLNVWRSVSDAPLARFPLAVCDRTSIDPDDLVYDVYLGKYRDVIALDVVALHTAFHELRPAAVGAMRLLFDLITLDGTKEHGAAIEAGHHFSIVGRSAVVYSGSHCRHNMVLPYHVGVDQLWRRNYRIEALLNFIPL
jgi:hypothetical protein